MKYLILITGLLIFNFSYAQPGGQGGRNGGGPPGGQMNRSQQQNEIPEFDAFKLAGVFSYDVKEAVQKIKIKKDKDLELKVIRTIVTYNKRMDELSLLNSQNFDSINIFMNTLIMDSRQRSNRGGRQMNNRQNRNNEDFREHKAKKGDPIRNYVELSKDKIDIVRMEVLKEEEELNNQLKAILNDKQFNKWTKYQNKIRKELVPPKQEANSQNRRGEMHGGQGRPPGGGNRF
ncbi:hypothetical protein RM697_09170 [Ichthyenterobacterium sp. W332]|uniref:DUF4168 domain-containing protein n=1 Tax=Microcosmobacter mediterraneus TaxID=3075607 RepID=A0ABU2YKX8_9FLAO|nr:hypothetical protein [Ichthyenterobacterium sp. W332]MDT0558818.1 hypothetical protein [Ichthyenterobacterium sp. W332]